ncbi:MAG: HTH-type transcriptional regulator BetI [Actinomycetota bacterium]
MTGEDTKQRILEAAIEVIGEQGEAAVRVVDVAHRAGVTQGMVTYHFGTRTNLVIEAQRQRYIATVLDDIGISMAALDSAVTIDSLMILARQMTDVILSPERNEVRRDRLNALGYAAGHALAWDRFRSASTELLDRWSTFFVRIAEHGLLRDGVTPRAAATMITAYSFGLVVTELDDRAPSRAELAEVINGFVRSMLID